jgi:hypothetical protein
MSFTLPHRVRSASSPAHSSLVTPPQSSVSTWSVPPASVVLAEADHRGAARRGACEGCADALHASPPGALSSAESQRDYELADLSSSAWGIGGSNGVPHSGQRLSSSPTIGYPHSWHRGISLL